VKLDFQLSSSCQPCHQEIYAQWKTLTHSKAFVDPVYSVVSESCRRKQGGLTQFCVSCHAPWPPLPVPSHLMCFRKNRRTPRIEDGVTCAFATRSLVRSKPLKSASELFFSKSDPNENPLRTACRCHQRCASNSALPVSIVRGTMRNLPSIWTPRFRDAGQDTYQNGSKVYAAQGTRCQDCHMPSYQGKYLSQAKNGPKFMLTSLGAVTRK
jgi:hypothetical protein